MVTTINGMRRTEKEYQRKRKEFLAYQKRHEDFLIEEGKKYNISVPKIERPEYPTVYFSLYVKPGKNDKEKKRNMLMVATLLGILGLGTSNGVSECYDHFGSDCGFHWSHNVMGWCKIESFDTTFFQPVKTGCSDFIIEVHNDEGEKVSRFIEEFFKTSGYTFKSVSGSASGCSHAWRYVIPDLLPYTTITLVTQIETGS